MGTRHNVVFTNDEIEFTVEGKIKQKSIKNAPKIYVHWDGYPSGALPILKDFLNSEGARHRQTDCEYLSAYYVAWKIIHDFGKTNLKELDDYRSIGIEASLSDWCDFTYIVTTEPTDATYRKFVVYILGYNYKLIEKIENINNLEKYEECDWWY